MHQAWNRCHRHADQDETYEDFELPSQIQQDHLTALQELKDAFGENSDVEKSLKR